MDRFVDQFFTQITGPADKFTRDAAPKLVLLHGVMGYALNWRRVAKVFEDRFEVLAYDSRGHGRSVHADLALVPNAYTPEYLAEDLRKILDDLGWNKISLIGHSMGGRVAYTFAAAHADRVERLVIEDIGPNMSPLNSSTVSRVLATVPVPFENKRSAKTWFNTEFPTQFKDLSNAAALGAWLYANITEDEQARAIWRFDAEGVKAAVVAGHTVERWDTIRNVKCPTLLIRGQLSKDLPREVFDRMLRENKVFQGVEIEGAGHWIHSEQADAFNQAVNAFFEAGNASH